MSRWLRYPFIRVTSAYIMGLWLAMHLHPSWKLSLLLIGIGLFAYSVVVLWPKNSWTHQWSPLIGAWALGIFFLMGMMRSGLASESDSVLPKDRVSYYQAVALRNSTERAKTNRTLVEIQQYKLGENWRSIPHQVMLYTPLSYPKINYGDLLLIQGAPRLVPAPANPEEFDYQNYLVKKGIQYQDFVATSDSFSIVGHQPPSALLDWAFRLRAKGQASIVKHVQGQRQQAIAMALLLGIRDSLDNDLKDAYAGAGAIHVLAVSGLHVGIIYMVLLGLLGPLRKQPGGKWFFAGLVLATLWFYALLTGWSPSVLRATIMFSFVVVAQTSRRDNNIYNTLFASALFLLFIDPAMITSVGFQMSYLAVLGIVYLQPKIASWWYPTAWLTHQFWRLTSTSLAAQIAVFPLGLYYFHQFPVYFVAANLVVIPAAFLILSLGFGLLLLSFSNPLASIIGKGLSWIVEGVNRWIMWIEYLPGSPLGHLYLNQAQVLLIFGFLLLVFLFFHYRKFAYLVGLGLVVFGFGGSLGWRYYQQARQQSVTFYAINSHSAADFFQGTQAYFVADPSLSPQSVDYHITPARTQAGVANNPQVVDRVSLENLKLLSWKEKIFVWVEGPLLAGHPSTRTSADYLILEQNSVSNLEEITRRFNFKTLIIGSTNSARLTEQLVAQAKELGLDCHSLTRQGALQINF